MITCAVFAPWILVYEEACLPWTDTHAQVVHVTMSHAHVVDVMSRDVTCTGSLRDVTMMC